MKRFQLLTQLGYLLVGLLILASCNKDYFEDGGTSKADYEGSIYDYLEANPYWFDTLTYIIDRAGMAEKLQEDTITFFAPTDDAIKRVMESLNDYRYRRVEDSVHLEDIDPEVWKYFISMHILDGKFKAEDFARVDPDNIYAYSGIDYFTSEGFIVNIGLVYEDYKGVKAVGARIIRLTDITADPNHFINCPSVTVMTSDIQPENGILHILNNNYVLGFETDRFVQMAEQYLLMSGQGVK